jgi:hypothetical protein
MLDKTMNRVDREIQYNKAGKWIWIMRNKPWHAARVLAGIVLPPHERFLIRTYFAGYKENNIMCSRGTSKSFTIASLCTALDAMLFKNHDMLVVSASGFRGGKLLFEDTKRLVRGELRSQKLLAPFMRRAAGDKVIRQEPDRWVIDWKSHSKQTTVPTKDEDTLRGIRAIRAVVDERNTFDGEVVQKVIRPMMNVGTEFEKIASARDDNAIFQVSTIDYTFRDWFKEINHAKELAKREYDAMQALQGQDWNTYDKLMSENKGELRVSSNVLIRFDYTDLMIPTLVEDEEGKRYEVHYPLNPGLKASDIVKWDERDGCHYWYTYPVAKQQLEEPLLNGTQDEEIWLAEQRNVPIQSSGSVYPEDLIRAASEVPIYHPGEIPNYDLGKSDEDRKTLEAMEFYAPVMTHCGDYCVLGVDYARERDETAFIVFRLGPLSPGKFDPLGKIKDGDGRPCYGQTPWSSLIWAESWPKMTHRDAAAKIRELRKRYNIINTSESPEGFGGIGMDGRGGGLGVRDELSRPTPDVENGQPKPWPGGVEPVKVYDPTDENYEHYAAYNDPATYWSGLRLLTPSNAENWEWTRYTKAAMESQQLYIGYWVDPSTWAAEKGLTSSRGGREKGNDQYGLWLSGYTGIQKLKKQLIRLQVEMTASGNPKVTMPGSNGTEDGKKDLYSAFIYGWHVARQHLVNATKREIEPPYIPPVAVIIGQDNPHSLGRMGWGGGLARGFNIPGGF